MAVDGSLTVVEAPVELEVSGEREADSHGDPAEAPPAGLPHHPTVDQDHRHAEVELGEELRVAVDVAQSGLDPQLAQPGQRLVAEMATGSGDQVDLHPSA